ncbi:MAG: class I SAM-dependent methyltransferase [Hyphomicrobiales bacterium]|nr:class I SAM-dependent methyltransferase [Hyphomicrobiales bacterium]MCP5000207.1 class I SAM-dependent methyltransferase [Hyphomicrobiales bacterium]
MSLYSRFVLPRLVNASCSTKPVMKQREKIVPLARGRVLEIGVGGGLNFPYLDSAEVDCVFGLDTSAELMEGACAKSEQMDIEFTPLILDAAQIPLDDGDVDTVLVTYTLCSIDALQSALSEMRRVLKPQGQLLFCEHGAAPDRSVNQWQKRLTPIWRRVGGGCRLDRDLPLEIQNAGFRLTSLEQMYLPGTARLVGYNSWGAAIPH